MLKKKKNFLKTYRLQQAKLNRLRETIVKYPENKEKYLAEIDQCEQKRHLIETQIYAIDNELAREVLLQKYLCGKTLEEISLITNYSKRHIERIHVRALNMLNIEF